MRRQLRHRRPSLSITVSFMSSGEYFVSCHTDALPCCTSFQKTFDGGASFGTFLVDGGDEVCDFLAVAGDNYGFAAFYGSEEFR